MDARRPPNRVRTPILTAKPLFAMTKALLKI
jgi:hypothetical protein